MTAQILFSLGALYLVIVFFVTMGRNLDTDQLGDSICCGILWPIYAPYRLALIMWSRQP